MKFYIDSLFSVEKAAAADSEEQPLKIVGYANTTTKDRMGDVIPMEAWTKGGLENFQANPIVLAFHNHSKPIGVVTEMSVDTKGLKVVAEISKAAGDVYALIKDGVLKAFSIGASVKDADYDSKTDIFVIKDLELLEVSVVSVPANQDSLFSLAKSAEAKEDYEQFKQKYLPTAKEDEDLSNATGKVQKEDEINMDKQELEQLIKSAVESATASLKAAPTPTTVETGDTGTERLIKDVQSKIDAVSTDVDLKLKDVIGGLEGVIKEKAAEIEASLKSKMSFEEKKSVDSLTYAEKETAVMLSAILGKSIEKTRYGAKLLEKAGPHQSGSNGADWEKTVSTNMLSDIRQRLILAPFFRSITMPTPVMRFPINPEAGYANWVNPTDYGAAASSGTAQTHQLSEVTLTTYKLATKEFITNEEDEDSLIALTPIIRDAIIRRMAKATDKALLRGAGSGASDPLTGVAKKGDTTSTIVTAAATGAVTVANINSLRPKLGVWGLDVNDLVYIVSSEVYYDLLNDSTFQTVDKIGNDRATLRTGQIGIIGGIPVVVSAEFEAKAATKYGAVLMNASNYLIGEQVGMRVEGDYLVQEQSRVLVASRRMAFQQVTTTNGSGVATFKWV